MPTNFTMEELYDAYSEQMRDYLKTEKGMTESEAVDLLEKTGFRRMFMEVPDLYDFCEPGEAVESLIWPRAGRVFVFVDQEGNIRAVADRETRVTVVEEGFVLPAEKVVYRGDQALSVIRTEAEVDPILTQTCERELNADPIRFDRLDWKEAKRELGIEERVSVRSIEELFSASSRLFAADPEDMEVVRAIERREHRTEGMRFAHTVAPWGSEGNTLLFLAYFS